MIFYHLDLFNKIPDNIQIIKPITDYSQFDSMTREFCQEKFPNGIGQFGDKFTCTCAVDSVDSKVFAKEIFLEYIRQIKAPSKISRFECIFGAKTPHDLEMWFLHLCSFYKLENLSNDASVYILDCEDASNLYFETNAYWRDIKAYDNNGKEVYNIAYEYYMCCKYWEGAKVSDLANSYPEILVRLPVKVIKKLKYTDFYAEYIHKPYK